MPLIQLLLITIFLSVVVRADTFLFQCIRNQDYDCLADELDLDQDWHTRTDENGATPLEYVISHHDARMTRYLVRKGAKVAYRHVVLALDVFFPDHREITIQMENNQRDDIERLLLLTVKARKGRQFDTLCQVLGIVATHQEVLSSIRVLFNQNKIDLYDSNILFREHRNLFFPFSIEQSKIIFNEGSDFNNEKFLLMMIIKIHESQRHKLTENMIVDGLYKISENNNQKIAYAIISNSLRIYSLILPELLLGNYGRDSVTNLFDKIDVEISNMINFIVQSIVEQRLNKMKKAYYDMWLSVYRLVVDQGDFLGAFVIDNALNHEDIKNLFSHDYKLSPLIDPSQDYYFYRKQVSLLKKSFFIPAWEVFVHDINDVFKRNLLLDDQTIHQKNLEKYSELRKNLKKYRRMMQKRNYISATAFHELVEAIAGGIDEDQRREYYKLISPQQRCCSMRLDLQKINASAVRAVTPRF